MPCFSGSQCVFIDFSFQNCWWWFGFLHFYMTLKNICSSYEKRNFPVGFLTKIVLNCRSSEFTSSHALIFLIKTLHLWNVQKFYFSIIWSFIFFRYQRLNLFLKIKMTGKNVSDLLNFISDMFSSFCRPLHCFLLHHYKIQEKIRQVETFLLQLSSELVMWGGL